MTNQIEKTKSILEDLLKAIEKLEEALSLNPNEIHKDATVQRFEFSFELAWKLMQGMAGFHGKEARSPRESIRVASDLKLIDSPEDWFAFLEARNLTSHTYDQDMADETYESAKKFPPFCRSFLEEVEKQLQK